MPASGTTLGATDNYNFKNTTCTGTFTAGGDVVYAFTPTVTTSYTFTLTPNGWDGELYLLPDCASAGAGMTACIAGADMNSVGGVETVTTALTANVTYFVVVDSYAANIAGPFTLQVDAPLVSECANATPLSVHAPGDSVSFNGVTVGTDSGDDSISCGGLGPEIAYLLEPSANVAVNVSVQSQALPDGGGMIPVTYIQQPCGYEQQELECFGGNVPGDVATIDANNLHAGQTYVLWIDSRQTSAGPFTATVSFSTPIPPPANDNCEGTVPLLALTASGDGGLAGSLPYNSLYADDTTLEPTDAACFGFANGADVVVGVYVPSAVTSLTLSTTGATQYQSLFLRQGPSCTDQQGADGAAGGDLGCTEFSPLVTGPLAAGVYYLWVDGTGQGEITATSP